MKKHRYVTQRAHGGYPARTPCLAYRDKAGSLILEFEGGGVVDLGGHYYLAGIEDRGSFLDRVVEQIQVEEDARFLELVNRCIDGVGR